MSGLEDEELLVSLMEPMREVLSCEKVSPKSVKSIWGTREVFTVTMA